MSAKIVKLAPTEPCPCVVARLEDLLVDARAGKVTMIALATVETGGTFTTGFLGDGDGLTLLGAVSLLHAQIVAGQLEEIG